MYWHYLSNKGRWNIPDEKEKTKISASELDISFSRSIKMLLGTLYGQLIYIYLEMI